MASGWESEGRRGMTGDKTHNLRCLYNLSAMAAQKVKYTTCFYLANKDLNILFKF